MSEGRWNLRDIYASEQAWEDDLALLASAPGDVSPFRGKLNEGPEVLEACLRTYQESLKRFYRVSSYASMRYHEDTRVGATAEMEQRARLVGTALSEAASFIDPEILDIGERTVRGWVEEYSGLESYAHALDDVLRRAAHTLTPGEEEIVATASLITDAPYSVYGMLANADLPWPTVTLSDGSEVRLDQSAYTRLRAVPERADREEVFRVFWDAWSGYARTFGATLYSQVKRDLFHARVRRYPNSLAAALDSDRIPETVYRTLISEANRGLPVLHRYFRLRARMLGIEQLRYHDIYPPLVATDRSFGIDEAKSIVL